MMDFVIDVSQNNDVHTEQSLKLLKDLGLVAMVIRLGDGYREDTRTNYFVELARKLNLPFGCYFVPYPGNDIQRELDNMNNILGRYPDCRSTFIDVEWYKYANGTTVPASISEKHYWQFYLKSNADAIYTAKWCVEGYFPKIADYLLQDQVDAKKLHWYANYLKYYPPFWRYINSLGGSLDPKDNLLINIAHLPTILELISTGKPDLPDPALDWAMWQCITYLPFKELTYWQRHLDYNLIKPKYLADWFGIGTPDEPPDYQKKEMKFRWNVGKTTVKPL